MMDRRDLLKMIMATTGLAMVGGKAFGYELKSQVSLSTTIFRPEDVILFNEVAEIILPRTTTPGAKDANVGLMALILANDCYAASERETLVKGLQALNAHTQTTYGSPYLLVDAEQKTAFIQQLDVEAKAYNQSQSIYYLSVRPYDRNATANRPVAHYFTLIKQLTLFCFFTSKEGATQVLRYDPNPGQYNGELEYKKGDRAWAT